MSSNLRNLAFELDYQLGSMYCDITTLQDAEKLISRLVENMEDAVHQGNERLSYPEHQRMVRVLWHLIRHTLVDLSRNYEKAEVVSNNLINLVETLGDQKKLRALIRGEESHIAGNDTAFNN